MTNSAGNSALDADDSNVVVLDAENANDALKAKLDDLARQWDKAEELMKLAERLRAEVVHPSVNELRYAGRRIVDAWRVLEAARVDAAKRHEFDGFVKDALFRCHCAQHDAIDASVLFVQLRLRDYEREFGHALLMKHLPDVADLRAALSEADNLIVGSRADRGKRTQEYDRLARDHLPVIVRIYQKIEANRGGLEAIVAENTSTKKTDARRFMVNAGIAAAGVLIAILVAVTTTKKGDAAPAAVKPSSPAATNPAAPAEAQGNPAAAEIQPAKQ